VEHAAHHLRGGRGRDDDDRAGGREPNAHRRKPDEPAEILDEHDGHRGDAGRSDEVLPAEQEGDGGSVHLSKIDEHAAGLWECRRELGQ
jgi:hypothetical protein